jgi:hypothetical protein
MARKKAKKGQKPLPGIALEKTVARLQQLLDPSSKVTHNEKLKDRTGNVRQYDVVMRGTWAGHSMLGIIECRDHDAPMGPGQVGAFAKQMEDLGATLKIMVSRHGFTDQALTQAVHDHITCLSLLPTDPNITRLSVGSYWYGIVRKWTDCYLSLHFQGPGPKVEWSYETLLWQKKPVLNWFLNELFTKHKEKEPGKYRLVLDFPKGLQIELSSIEYVVHGIVCYATLTYTKKRKWVGWTGEAFFDWHKGQIQIPGDTPLISTGVETDIDLWEDYNGDIPESVKGNEILVRFVVDQYLPDDRPIPDLMSTSPAYNIFALVS